MEINIEEYLGLVYMVARPYSRRAQRMGYQYEDMVGAGVLGLIQAAKGFDSGLGLQFSTFAVPRIRGSILDELRLAAPGTRRAFSRGRLLASADRRLTKLLNRFPTDRELANDLGILDEELQQWIQKLEVANGRLDGSLLKLFDEPREYVDLYDALDTLKDNHAAVIYRSFWEGDTLLNMANELGVTESRMSQVRKQAVEHIRKLIDPPANDQKVPVPKPRRRRKKVRLEPVVPARRLARTMPSLQPSRSFHSSYPAP